MSHNTRVCTLAGDNELKQQKSEFRKCENISYTSIMTRFRDELSLLLFMYLFVRFLLIMKIP